MTALAAAKNSLETKMLGEIKSYPCGVDVLYYGALVMIDSNGYALPAAASAGNKGVVGIAIETVDNSGGSAGDLTVRVQAAVVKLAGATLGQDDVGSHVYATDDQTVDETPGINLPFAGVMLDYVDASTAWVAIGFGKSAQEVHGEWSWDFPLANLTDGDMVTAFTPGFAGYLVSAEAHVTVAATTAAKASTINLEIGTTDATGSLVLTSANMTPLGAVVAQALSGGTFFGAADTVSIEASSTTAFIEGEIMLKVRFKQLIFG